MREDGQNLSVRISVITICHNAADTIVDTLRSVAEQTYPYVEHVIIDGGSTDGTLELIKQYGAHTALVISEPDNGIYDAMNKGWQYATGDVIAFLNADDTYMHTNVLQEVAETMADSQYDACYADLLYVGRDNTERIIRYWKGGGYKAGNCLKGWMPAHPTFFARREVFERAGGFDTHYQRQADFELMLRWFEVYRIRALYIPRIWTRMRMGGVSNNSLLGIIKGNIEAYRACRVLEFKVTPFFIVRKIASRIPQYWRRPENLQ